MIELEVAEELERADNELNLIETDRGSSFKRPERTRSPLRRTGSGSGARARALSPSYAGLDRARDLADDVGPQPITRSVSPATLPTPPSGNSYPVSKPLVRTDSHNSARSRSPQADSPPLRKHSSPKKGKDLLRQLADQDRSVDSTDAQDFPEEFVSRRNKPVSMPQDMSEEEYRRYMERRLEERLARADKRRQEQQQTGAVEGRRLGLSGARGSAHTGAFTDSRRNSPPGPVFSGSSRWASYNVAGRLNKGQGFLKATKEEKRQEELREARRAVREHSPSYSRTLGL